MPLLVPVIRITDIRAPFASREAAKRLLGGAVGAEEALDPELVQGDVVGCSEAGEDREEAQRAAGHGRSRGSSGDGSRSRPPRPGRAGPPSHPPIYADAVRPPITSEVVDSPPDHAENAAMLRVAFAGPFAENIRRAARGEPPANLIR